MKIQFIHNIVMKINGIKKLINQKTFLSYNVKAGLFSKIYKISYIIIRIKEICENIGFCFSKMDYINMQIYSKH